MSSNDPNSPNYDPTGYGATTGGSGMWDWDEEVIGNDTNQTFYTYGGDDYVEGKAGEDFIILGGGNDTAYGGKGRDKLWGEWGDDWLDGGKGDDEISGGKGDDVVIGGEGDDWLWGNSGNDILLGGDGKDTMYGGADDDLLYGDDGADKLFGDGGSDILWGGKGADIIKGGAGRDEFHGGLGNDVMTGGGGDDTFNFDMTSQEMDVNQIDRIKDFDDDGDDILLFGNTGGVINFVGQADLVNAGDVRATKVGSDVIVEVMNTQGDIYAIELQDTSKAQIGADDFGLMI